jgi:DNA-binding transcriptional MerR regulator
MHSYSIAQLSERSGLSPYTLRYYEKESLIQQVPRDAGGRRRYGDVHLKVIKFVNALRATGMPIREIKRYLAFYQMGPATRSDRLELLESHRADVKAELEAVRANLKVIDRKIMGYKEGKY